MRYDQERPEMVGHVPFDARVLLDVGCATGRFGAALRARSPQMKLWGMDPVQSALLEFENPYDHFVSGFFPDDLPDGVTFDCIVFNDVLEHMEDPWSALEQARRFLTRQGLVIASIPNVRHVQVVVPLVLHGSWEYSETGILDRTHLRFFTRSSMEHMFRSTGYSVDTVEPIRFRPNRGKFATANTLLRGKLNDLLAERYAIVARPRFDPEAR